MKKMKKMISFLLTMIMVLSMAFGSMAAEAKGSITIDNAVKGQTYRVYQILNLESYNAESNAYAYKANSSWETWLRTQTTYVSFDDQGYVTWVEDANATEAEKTEKVAAFAKAAQAYANVKENNISADAEETASSTEVKFEKLKLGYYLVDTTLGTLCSLDTTNPDVTMKEKNEAPTVEKEVQEDSKVDMEDEWGKVNDADINQTVNFKATITVKPGAENYVLHDTMSEGLTYVGVTSVKIGNTDVPKANYTVVSEGLTDGCTFEVSFIDAYVAELEKDTEIVVEYSAILNKDAVVGLSGNPNKVKLEYGDKANSTFTPESKTITYTWDASVLKYTLKDGKEIPLAGATFTLSKSQDGANPIKFHALGENVYQVCADENCTEEQHVTEITTDATGSFVIKGLDADTYYLTEIQAPAGYNKVADAQKIVITGAGTGENNEVTYTTVETKVLNQSGTELPSTGGTGTTIFYIVGGILVVAAGVLLVVRKRADMEE